jgi:phage shock protein PspC (stress-responsive transcriptional regulator)
MVKKAEKIKKRNPLLPVLGLLLTIPAFIIASALVTPLETFAKRYSGDFNLGAPKEWVVDFAATPIKFAPPSQSRIFVAVVIWLFILTIAYLIVAILIGRDPDSSKNNPLPPRNLGNKR